MKLSNDSLRNAFWSLGDLKQAIKYHNQSLIIAKELGSRAGEVAVYGTIGNVFDSLDDLKEL